MANLHESLEQYVKCDLLEGANAYHCEECNKKVIPIPCSHHVTPPIAHCKEWSYIVTPTIMDSVILK